MRKPNMVDVIIAEIVAIVLVWKRVVQESDFFYREKLSKNTQVRLR